jgi:hypothetical protein
MREASEMEKYRERRGYMDGRVADMWKQFVRVYDD